MFHRVTLRDGRAVWRSDLLQGPVPRHAFTTRQFNIRSAGDVCDLAEAAGWGMLSDRRVRLSRQVHGNRVTVPHGHPGGDRPFCPIGDARWQLAAAADDDAADAHVIDMPGHLLAVRTADCVPVLLSSADGRVVGAVHAGWRGLDPETNVIAVAVRRMHELLLTRRSLALDLVAAIGPCISGTRYEVGDEVAERFAERYPAAVATPPGRVKPHLDLRAVAVAQLREAGVAPKRIDVFPGCCFDQADDFFSYRREGIGVGHLAAVIMPRGG